MHALDADKESSIDASYVLGLARKFLGATAPPRDDAIEDWEGAGCLLWDVAAVPALAALLVAHGVDDMLVHTAVAACAQQRWRAVEIAVGALGNMACCPRLASRLAAKPALVELLTGAVLWSDNSACLCEDARLLAALLMSEPRVRLPVRLAACVRAPAPGCLAFS